MLNYQRVLDIVGIFSDLPKSLNTFKFHGETMLNSHVFMVEPASIHWLTLNASTYRSDGHTCLFGQALVDKMPHYYPIHDAVWFNRKERAKPSWPHLGNNLPCNTATLKGWKRKFLQVISTYMFLSFWRFIGFTWILQWQSQTKSCPISGLYRELQFVLRYWIMELWYCIRGVLPETANISGIVEQRVICRCQVLQMIGCGHSLK